jgi:hypothetical protein
LTEGFEVHTAVVMKGSIFWGRVPSCGAGVSEGNFQAEWLK